MKHNILRISWEDDLGKVGEDSNPDNPISRSLRKLLENGQPFERYTQVFVANESAEITSDNYHLNWLGVLVLSDGQRIIFFPGLSKIREKILGYKRKQLLWDQEFEIDHISLEKDWKRWHITNGKSINHLGSINTADLGKERRLWFGLSVSDFCVFQSLFQKTSVVASIPETDVDRRIEIFKKSREEAKFQIVEPPPLANRKYKFGFLHMSFIVGPKGFEFYKGDNHGYPIDSPFIENKFPKILVGLPIRFHRISLSEEIDIQITVTKIPGRLKVPVSFTVNV